MCDRSAWKDFRCCAPQLSQLLYFWKFRAKGSNEGFRVWGASRLGLCRAPGLRVYFTGLDGQVHEFKSKPPVAKRGAMLKLWSPEQRPGDPHQQSSGMPYIRAPTALAKQMPCFYSHAPQVLFIMSSVFENYQHMHISRM